MILVDTSVWIDHLQNGNSVLSQILEEDQVLLHPFVMGELACGSMQNRSRILADLKNLPSAATATDEEVLRLIEDRKLWGDGIGWIDWHLIASALLSTCRLWTLDLRLRSVAQHAGVRSYSVPV